MVEVTAYIDGLNVYEGLMQKRRRDLLWLDYRSLLEDILLPEQTLVDAYYFTAHRRTPPESYARQQVYFRALDARGGIERVEGTFDRRKVRCEHCGRLTEAPRERATDVQLASFLLADAAAGRMEMAMLLSGDSDYVKTVELTRLLGVDVLLVRIPGRRSDDLAAAASYVVDLNVREFRRNLLPDPVVPPKGRAIHCPFEWLSLDRKIDRLHPTNQAAARAIVAATPQGREPHLHPLIDALRASEAT